MPSPIAGEVKLSTFTLDHHLTHRAAGIVGDVVGETIAVKDAAHAAPMSEDRQTCILTCKDGVQLPQIGPDTFDRTKEPLKQVEEMYPGLVH